MFQKKEMKKTKGTNEKKQKIELPIIFTIEISFIYLHFHRYLHDLYDLFR